MQEANARPLQSKATEKEKKKYKKEETTTDGFEPPT